MKKDQEVMVKKGGVEEELWDRREKDDEETGDEMTIME